MENGSSDFKSLDGNQIAEGLIEGLREVKELPPDKKIAKIRQVLREGLFVIHDGIPDLDRDPDAYKRRGWTPPSFRKW